MDRTLPNFSKTQWAFLAVLAIFDSSIPIETACRLAPLSPGSLLDILKKGKAADLILEYDGNRFSLSDNIHPAAIEKIRAINTDDKLSAMVNHIEKLGLINQIKPDVILHLEKKTDKESKAARAYFDLAENALQKDKMEEAMVLVEKTIQLLKPALENDKNHALFVSAVLLLSQIRYCLGKKLGEIPDYLGQARYIAEKLGDKRSLAIIGLHLGRLYYLGAKISDAASTLSLWLEAVEELGDKDIQLRAAEFHGIFYYIQGMHIEAAEYFDMAIQNEKKWANNLISPLTPAFFSFSATCIGQLNRAIGVLESNWRWARQEKHYKSMASHYQATLGYVLLIMGEKEKAGTHLTEALKEAHLHQNILAILLCQLALAYSKYLENNIKTAYQLTVEAITYANESGIKIRHYPLPIFLELLYEFDRLHYDPVPQFEFKSEMHKLLNGPNIHLKGVALRFQGKAMVAKGEDDDQVYATLMMSKDYLTRSGDTLELARTRLEMVKVMIRRQDFDSAKKLSLKAWKGLSGFGSFFSRTHYYF